MIIVLNHSEGLENTLNWIGLQNFVESQFKLIICKASRPEFLWKWILRNSHGFFLMTIVHHVITDNVGSRKHIAHDFYVVGLNPFQAESKPF